MMNKYGYFEYEDFAFGAKEGAQYSINHTLQKGSDLSQLREGVQPYEFCGFELNDYITETPKLLYPKFATSGLGVATADVSNEDGTFVRPVELTSVLDGYYTTTGLTISSGNIITSIKISAFRDDVLVKEQEFTATKKDYFYNFSVELVNKIVISVSKIAEANHFLRIFDIKYGKYRTFDETTNTDVMISNYYSVKGDALEYDTLDLTIQKDSDVDYLFQRKQPLKFIKDGKIRNVFYIEQGEESDNNTMKITAYDVIANLEDEFLGGMYQNEPFDRLIKSILGDVPYDTIGTSEIKLTGYIPIVSKRKALMMICGASNIRVARDEKLHFKPLEKEQSATFDETNVLENPMKTNNQEVKSVKILQHNYSKGTDRQEVYHWYISKTENVLLKFSEPLHDLKAYEVTGEDENGNDIVSETPSKNVTFIERGANYCIVKNKSNNKIVINGAKYIDSTVDFVKTSKYLTRTGVYQEIAIEDLTILSDPKAVLDLLFELYTRKQAYTFQTIDNAETGSAINIFNNTLNVKSVKNGLNGVLEVEVE